MSDQKVAVVFHTPKPNPTEHAENSDSSKKYRTFVGRLEVSPIIIVNSDGSRVSMMRVSGDNVYIDVLAHDIDAVYGLVSGGAVQFADVSFAPDVLELM